MIGPTEFDQIVETERLRKYLHMGVPDGTTSNKVCVFQDGTRWVTVTTDERASVIDKTLRTFEDELDALEDALEALRFERDLVEYRP
ncbi:hypothetical protein [Microbacterium sp. Bi128]|uniref:hypothetical protein n=1 Tax=Microbacterium sp. Bi128 TaxID=2821115 RepID=UPI001D9746EC|nr:hypothetical protein [Microbacterium sp. Bi128]CAH0203013.1 hypothetical protein SRABI128_01786 [Microbacterium sp. Bi128]